MLLIDPGILTLVSCFIILNKKSASCTHVSALLHSLLTMISKNSQVSSELLSLTIPAYIEHKQNCGISELTVEPCGFFMHEGYPFLGITPDGTVYDLLSSSYPLRLLEVKFPYSQRDRSPGEACAIPDFCSQLELHLITPKKLCPRETTLTSSSRANTWLWEEELGVIL